ncbi:MAG TPA: hypothetical protein VMZ27_03975 [Candidatus Saccharimonadales bacterium]|nr:hypothetical protein [Candidatus Saccharimonadales bacterium]
MAANPEYKRAGTKGRTLSGEHRLFVGSDHLLLVINSGYVEVSKRFNFRDIQSIIIQESPARLIWNWVLGFGLGCSLIFVILSWEEFPFRMLMFGLAAVFAIPLFLNNARGPSCTCHIQSAVQRERLYSLSRTETARRFLEEISSRLLQAQSSVAPRSTTGIAPGPESQNERTQAS